MLFGVTGPVGCKGGFGGCHCCCGNLVVVVLLEGRMEECFLSELRGVYSQRGRLVIGSIRGVDL